MKSATSLGGRSSAAGSSVAVTWACASRSAMYSRLRNDEMSAVGRALAANGTSRCGPREGGLSTKFSTFVSTEAVPRGDDARMTRWAVESFPKRASETPMGRSGTGDAPSSPEAHCISEASHDDHDCPNGERNLQGQLHGGRHLSSSGTRRKADPRTRRPAVRGRHPGDWPRGVAHVLPLCRHRALYRAPVDEVLYRRAHGLVRDRGRWRIHWFDLER